MANFPTIAMPDWENCSEQRIKEQVRSPFESGSVLSRPQHTKARYRYTIGWNGLTPTDYATLVLFFDTYVGSTFYWEHYLRGTQHLVRFSEGKLPNATSVGFNYWKLTGLVLEDA